MSLNTAIPVRFKADVKARLESVAASTGVPLAQLVRIATEALLQKIERDSAVTIPLLTNPETAGLNDKSIKEAELSGAAQIGLAVAASKLPQKPKAVLPSDKTGGPTNRAPRAKNAPQSLPDPVPK